MIFDNTADIGFSVCIFEGTSEALWPRKLRERQTTHPIVQC